MNEQMDLEDVLAERVDLHARLAAVEALLPTGPRPTVDLHAIGQWDLGKRSAPLSLPTPPTHPEGANDD